MNSDIQIANIYLDLPDGILDRVYRMLGNVDEQIQPHGVGQTIFGYEYIVPLAACFNRDISNFFPQGALINRKIRIEGCLKTRKELFIVEDSRNLFHEQLVIYLEPAWVNQGFDREECIQDFRFVYKYARVTDNALMIMQTGGQGRNINLEVNDPCPRYEPFCADGCSDFNYIDLGIKSDVHHIFYAVKNTTHAAEHSIYRLHRPVMVIPPILGTHAHPRGFLGRMDFNPHRGVLAWCKVKFDYNDTYIEVESSDVGVLESPYESCQTYPDHLEGLAVRCYDAFFLHPPLNEIHYPKGDSTCIKMGFAPSQALLDIMNEDRFIRIDEREFILPRPKFRCWVDVVTIKILRLEQGMIGLAIPEQVMC